MKKTSIYNINKIPAKLQPYHCPNHKFYGWIVISGDREYITGKTKKEVIEKIDNLRLKYNI